MKKLINLIAITVLAVAGAQADISITLDNPNQTGGAGQTLSFFGVITNTDSTTGDAPIFLNGDSLTFTLNSATVADNFFANVPVKLGPGASSGDIDLFDITLAKPETNPLGTYTGSYELIGGADGGNLSGQDTLAQANFSVNATPEPGYFAFLAVGLVLMVWLHRRRKTQAAQNQ